MNQAFRWTMAATLAAAAALAVETKTWVQSESSEFEKGTLKGLALASNGRLTLAPQFKEVFDAAVPHLWSTVADARGRVYAGGDEGKLFVVEGGKGRLLATLEGGGIYAMAVSPKGELYAAVSPNSKIYRIAADGAATVFHASKANYIWALAFDAAGTLYAATGDPGQVHKIAADGQATVFLDTEELHVRSLALDSKGQAWAGTEPSGLVYRVSPAGQGFVVVQTGKREVTAVAAAPDGTVYASASGNRSATPPIAPAPAPAQTPPGQITVTVGPGQPQPQAAAGAQRPLAGLPPTFSPAAPPTGGSEIWKIATDGEPQRVWTNAQQLVYALSIDAKGRVLTGCGNQGRIYRIDSPLESTLLAQAESSQVTGMAVSAGGAVYAIASNPGRVYQLGPALEKQGTLESEVFDAGTFTYWGRLRWDSTARGGSIQLETRSGNLERPEKTWSPWAAVDAAAGGRVPSPAARFLQWKATLKVAPDGSSPELSLVEAAYQAKNIAPVIEKIEVAPENYKFPSSSSGSSSGGSTLNLPPIGQPRRTSPSTPNTEPSGPTTLNYDKGWISARWKASDANGDTLRYKVEIQGAADTSWMPLKDDLKENRISFDSSTLPDGQYRLRVIANDRFDNYAPDALTASLDSETFTVDNTPPQVTGLTATAQGNKILLRFQANDAISALMLAECSVNGGDWIAVPPTTRLTDSQQHQYQMELDKPATGEVIIAVKVSDENDNVTVQRTVLR